MWSWSSRVALPNNVFYAIRRSLLGLFAVLLILLAVSFSLFRLLLPELPELQRDIEAMASDAIGKPLVIGSMQAEWSGWGPRLIFEDVSIRSPVDSDELVGLRQLAVGTHIFQLFSKQPLRPASVDAQGLRLVVEQTDNGRLRLRGFDGSAGNQSDFLGPLLDFLAARGRISLGRTEVVWVPAGDTGLDTESAWFDLAFRSGGGEYHIELSGKPPNSIGENVELVLDAEGSMADMVNMRGSMFARLQGFQLHSPWVQPLLAALPLDIRAGVLERGDINLQWDRQKTTKVTSHISLQALQLSLDNESSAQRDRHLVESFVGDLSWESHESSSEEVDALKNLAQLGRKWTVSSEKAQLTVAGEVVEVEGLTMHSAIGTEDEGRKLRFHGQLDSLLWGDVFDQAEALPFPSEMASVLQQMAPSGRFKVEQFDVSHSADGGLKTQAKGAFSELGWGTGKVAGAADENKGWPGFENLAGRFTVDNDVVDVELDSSSLIIDWPWLYEGRRSVDTVAGQLSIAMRRTDDNSGRIDGLAINAPSLNLAKEGAAAEVAVAVNAQLGGPKVAGDIKLQGKVRNGTVPLVKRFIPAFTPATAQSWLQGALLAGQVDAEVGIDGPLQGFPYEANEGSFRVDADVSGGAIEFAEDWPALSNVTAALLFRNIGLMARVAHAETEGVVPTRLNVNIPNLRLTDVNIVTEATAPVSKLLGYVRQSPLKEPVAPLLKGLSASGEADLSLQLHVPVSNIGGLKANGELVLEDTKLRSSEFLALDNINGRVGFTEARVLANDIRGQFHGFDAAAQLDLSLVGGDMLITAETQLDLDEQPQHKAFMGRFMPDWLLNILSGSSALQVDLSGRDGAAPGERIRVTSSLEGVAVNGPSGIEKRPEWQAPFELLVDRSAGSGMAVTANARGLGGAALWLADEDDGELRRAEFAVGNINAVLPTEDGIGVVVDLPKGDLDYLLSWFAEQQPEAAAAPARNMLLPDFLDYLSLRSDEFRAFGINWRALNANIRRQENAAQLTMKSADGAGTVLVPDSVVSAAQVADLGEAARALQKRRLAAQIEVDFDYLYLPDLVRTPEAEAVGPPAPVAASTVDPRELPVVRARIRDGRYMGVRLGQIDVVTEPGVSGLVMRRLTSRGGELALDASGRWDVYEHGHHSELEVKLSSGDWDAVMNGIDLPDVLGAKGANVDVKLQWPGPMTQFDAERASGGFSVDFEEGQIYQVDPGLGRILGLFSFYTLPKRLLLDFSDIAKSGLTFDRITGDFAVSDGNAWTDNLEIKARGADAMIVGRAGLLEQDYDQRITVRPQIGGGTAVVGALVSGLGVGALLLLGNELFGQPFDELGVLRFHLTGSWDEPLINGEPIPEKPKVESRPATAIQFGRPSAVVTEDAPAAASEASAKARRRGGARRR